MIVHAGLVAWRRQGLWRGALIQGPSGSGKSDLALRAVDSGACFVADDRVLVWRSGDRLYGRAPDALSGLTEVRGVQVLGCAHVSFCEITLLVCCEAEETPIQRVYDGETDTLLDLAFPRLRLHPLDASAPAKLRRAFDRLGRERGAP